ncbi:GxxExxY protein [Pedobacter aquatilis]|uniref:GxxExxY protein n=1 Tax=Pedobacter aquatilis TaxID=351343 RepID=UPI0025B5A0E5|nr:GxxExxY protein [Pedobacter aquatilis]MDN3586838.1 GxxExxY protein [Pedobacter aquatilis]
MYKTKIYNQDDYPLQDETYNIIGIAMEVHRILGKGLLEIVYKDAIEYELITRDIPYKREQEYLINYKGTILPHKFYADFLIYDEIIVEIKSKAGIIDEHYAQLINYLGIAKLEVGLIINFNEKSLQYKRVIN